MRLHKLLALSHLAALVVGGLFATTVVYLPSLLISSLIGLTLIAGLAVYVGRNILRLNSCCRELGRLPKRVAGHQISEPMRTCGILEFDDAAGQICQHVERLATDAASGLGQLEQFEQMVRRLDRRYDPDANDGQTSLAQRLERLLLGYASTLEADLGQINSCGREIKRCTDQISTGTEDQAHAINKTTNLVERISQQIDTIIDDATQAKECVHTSRDAAQQGLQLLDSLIQEITQIESLVSSRGKRLRALGDSTLEISSIVEMIATISSRTDLLALNASIESVRAGEHGRGFAVVAEEVRSLAEQSAAAARDAAMCIESIQTETQQSVSVIEDEQMQVVAALDRLASARKLLETIALSSRDSASRNVSIAETSDQQLKVAEEFVDMVQRISESTRTSRTQVEGIRWTTKALDKLINQLKNYTANFRPNESRVLTTQLETSFAQTEELANSAS